MARCIPIQQSGSLANQYEPEAPSTKGLLITPHVKYM